MAFKVSFFWQQQSSKTGGWTENFWNTLTDVSALAVAAESLRSVMDTSKGAQAFCNQFRISAAQPPRNTQNVNVPGATVVPVTGTNDADYPSTALQLKMTAAGNLHTTQWYRGLKDTIISNSGQYNPTSQFKSQFGLVVAELKNSTNQWAVRTLDPAVNKLVVTSLDATTGIVTCPAHGYGPTGTTLKVRIQGFANPKQANKVWRITVIDANTFQLNFWTALTGVTVSGINPTARKQVYIFTQISNCEVVRSSSHRTGRPTNLLGGRRKRRAS